MGSESELLQASEMPVKSHDIE